MPFWPAAQAAVLYLLPILAFAGLRFASSRSVPKLAVDLPCAVAVDLLAIFAAARFVRLDAAVFLVRGAWLVPTAIGVRLAIRHRRAMSARILLVLGAAAVVAFLASAWRSHPFAIWDRQWHIPLTASLRGQSLPFVNVYQPQLSLGYHLSGNVLAATLQALSAARLHSSAALSLAHDLVFALTGGALAALMLRPGFGRWTLWVAPLLPAAVLFAGPIAISAAPGLGTNNGFSYYNFFELSFRPHVVLAGLLIVGITAAVLLMGDPAARPPPARSALVAGVPCLALLAITDEPSAGMGVAALMAATLVSKEALPDRKVRFLWAAVWPATVALALLLFPSTFSGNAVRLPVRVTAPHLPSLLAPAMPLPSVRGLVTMLADFAPLLGILVLAGIWAIRERGPNRQLPGLMFAAVALGLATIFLTTVVVANSAGESHRFMTLPMVVFPILGLYLIPSFRRPLRAVLAIVLATPVVFSLIWAQATVPVFRQFDPNRYAAGIHRTDCRDAMGARLFEPARPTYAPAPVWYAWAGCRPVFAPGRSQGVGNQIDVGRPIFGWPAVERLSAVFAGADDDVQVACPGSAVADPICRILSASTGCQPEGSDWRVCRLDAKARSTLLANPR